VLAFAGMQLTLPSPGDGKSEAVRGPPRLCLASWAEVRRDILSD